MQESSMICDKIKERKSSTQLVDYFFSLIFMIAFKCSSPSAQKTIQVL